MNVRWLSVLTVLLASACVTAPPSSEVVFVVDSHTGCEGGGPHMEYRWERDGDWFVRGDRRVPAGLVTRLRELAVAAPDAKTAPLPPELRFSEEELFQGGNDAWEAVLRWMPWLEDWYAPDLTAETVEKIIREQMVGERMSTDWSELSLTLPGDPPIVISTERRRPYAQPWTVTVVGEGRPRKVLSLDLSRHVMLLVDPGGPNYAILEGARYWSEGFWHDEGIWSHEIGDVENEKYARELCAELDGWDEVEEHWRLADADIGHINSQPLSLQPDLRARGESLIDFVRWWNPLEDGDPEYDWTTFRDVVERATVAGGQFPFLAKWKAAGPNRTISLDVAGDEGHSETQPGMYFDPPWRDADLDGDPEFELYLRIDGKVVATLLVGPEADGAVVLDGDETLADTGEIYFHPKNGKYAVMRRDGRTETRTIED